MTGEYSELNIRKSHPFLHDIILFLLLLEIGLGFNFWFARPTFTPYGIHKTIAGTVFFILGISQLTFLHVRRNIGRLRDVMSWSGFVLFVWGVVNTQQVIHGKASWTVPMTFSALAACQYRCARASVISPTVGKK